MLWPRWIWLRALGLIFLSVFYSLAFQIEGLVGPRGILPASEYLSEVRDAAGPWKAAWFAPTLFWLGSSDGALLAVTLLGTAASVLLALNVAPRACIAVAGICFLSFVAAAQDFSGYQSDGMLLEAAFLSLFLAPRGLRPGLGAADPPSRLAVFMLPIGSRTPPATSRTACCSRRPSSRSSWRRAGCGPAWARPTRPAASRSSCCSGNGSASTSSRAW